jgi:hypothetical protein
MKRNRNESEERRVEELLAGTARATQPPPEHELRAMARAAAESPRMPPASATRMPLWRPLHLRWAAVVAAALLAGSGFGFGLGSREASDGAAGTKLVGFGFLSSEGWTVVQSGTAEVPGATHAIAANVPFHPEDDLRQAPYRTLESLPAHGVLIFATFAARGDPAEDARFAERRLPLQVAGAKPLSPTTDRLPFARRLARYRLRAAVGAYNVDLRIYFGTVPAREAMIDVAQRQLNRLVVASERVTIAARPSILRADERTTLFGTVENGKPDELVRVQSKDCGQRFFRDVASATTRDGGGWSTELNPGINTTVRAVWNETASSQIAVRQRPVLLLRRLPTPARRFEVSVSARTSFWRKRVAIERFDRRLGRWVRVKSVVLTETGTSAPGYGFAQTSAKFSARVPRGALVRAVLPRSQARPCYLAGYSKLLQT